MTKGEITDKILEIVCNKFKIEKKEIPLDSTLDSFYVNSLDLVEVIIDIEDVFKIRFPDDIAFKFYIITSTPVVDFIASMADCIDMIINNNK